MLWKGKKPPIKPFFFLYKLAVHVLKERVSPYRFFQFHPRGCGFALPWGASWAGAPRWSGPSAVPARGAARWKKRAARFGFCRGACSLSVLSPVVWKKSELSRSRPPRARTERWVSFFCSSGARVVWGWMPLKPAELNQPHSKENRPVGLQNIYPHDFTGFLLLQIHKSLYQPTSKIIKP